MGKVHWIFRYLLTLICIVLAPVIFFVAGSVSLTYLMMERCCACVCSSCASAILLLPFTLVLLAIALTLGMTGAALVVGIGIVPFYLVMLVILFRIMFLWCLCSKRGKKKVERKEEAKKAKNRNSIISDH